MMPTETKLTQNRDAKPDPRLMLAFADRLMRFKRDEDGGLILFSLFVLIMMLIIGGMAVDLMRFETRRTELQNTLDSASLAATSLSRDSDPAVLVRDFMEKRGYDPSKVYVDPWESRVGGDPDAGEEGTLVARRITATYDLEMDTFFMPLIGIEQLGTTSGGTAYERVQNVEISLVVDISGSMGGQKLSDLKNSATNFFNSVIDEEREEGITTVSVIPYNHSIVVPDILLDRLDTMASATIDEADMARPSPGDDPYDGALDQYPLYTELSKCIRFFDDDLTTDNLEADYEELRQIDPDEALTRMAYYDPDGKSAGSGGSYDPPAHQGNRRCDPTRGQILPFETSIQELTDHINALNAGGWTAIDNGLKWASALLDPAFRPLVDDMIDSDLLPEKVRDRPADYDPVNTMKVIVLMTDGANTNQYDLKPEFKNGPSRIWFSEMASTDEDPDGTAGNTDWEDEYIVESDGGPGPRSGVAEREKNWMDGYFVEMPDNGLDERFMRPHLLNDNNDARLYAASELPEDAVQMDYVELYEIFSERALADLFRDENIGDSDARSDHRDAESKVENGNSANQRMLGTSNDSLYGLCDAVKHKENEDDDPDVLIFSIAFQAGSTAESVLRECATSSGYYFDAANGEELNEAFAAIAGAISKLRLTQ